MTKVFLYIALLSLFVSCASRKQMIYLQDAEDNSSSTVVQQLQPTIQANDLLTIVVSAADVKATLPFNQQNVYQMNAATSPDLAFRPTYLVDENGFIDFPVIGSLKLGGLTRLEAIERIGTELKRFITNPGVTLTFTNFRVTVLGEVRNPGGYTLLQERVTVLDALGLAGDLTIKGLRDNILLIREKDGVRSTHRLDLTSKELLKSPYFYLNQNDVIYVEPNSAQLRDSGFGQNTNVLISISSLVITILTLVFTVNRN